MARRAPELAKCAVFVDDDHLSSRLRAILRGSGAELGPFELNVLKQADAKVLEMKLLEDGEEAKRSL